jgi:hypothetical protein
VERRLGSTNRTVWDLVVVLGVLIVGAAAGFWFSEQSATLLATKRSRTSLLSSARCSAPLTKS